MKYIITESQEADLILKVVFGKEQGKEGFFSKLLKMRDSDFELGKAILEKVKRGDVTDVKEISSHNLGFTYSFKVNDYPFVVKYRYKYLKDGKGNRYSIKSPWISDKDIDMSDDLISLITDYVFPKGYQIQTTMDILDDK